MILLRRLLRAALISLSVVTVLASCRAFTASVLANDLRELQDRAGLHPPFILVAASIGVYRVDLQGTNCGIVRGMLPCWIPERLVHVDLDDFEAWWRDLQQRFAERSTRGRWRVVPHSGHLTANSQPHEVAEAVLDVLAETRRFAADTSPPQ